MLQVTLAGGEINVLDVPRPAIREGCVLVQTSHSLISSGTEGAGVTGRAESLAIKAVKNPDLVRKVLERAKTHGLKQTMDLVRSRIVSTSPIGYSSSGTIVEVAHDVSEFRAGDRVACAGAGYANHAAYNVVPVNLVTPLYDNVSFQEAAFTTLGAIALHGVRRTEPTLGESVVVLGLGLLGQLTVQILAANGCRPIGIDVLSDRVERALNLGMKEGWSTADRDMMAGVLEHTKGHGADAVIVCAAGADPALLNKAFDLCRRKGRVTLVGDVPIRIQREKIYRKELDFRISTSYGPGRYDPSFKEKGNDYPFGYVRWTESRNMAEVVRLISTEKLCVEALIDSVFPVGRALDAYMELKSARRPIGVLLSYEGNGVDSRSKATRAVRSASIPKLTAGREPFRVGVVGYGGYFSSVLRPLLQAHKGFRLHSVCSRNGLTVRNAQKNDGFSKGFTEWSDVIEDPDVDVVFIVTRHDQHYAIARAALSAGKHVFVEKPMTMTSNQGADLIQNVEHANRLLTVGFNRRFSAHSVALAQALRPIGSPMNIMYRVNAGALPPDHWLRDPDEGGGRLLGEGVHFFDLMRFLTRSDPVSVKSAISRGSPVVSDSASVLVDFADGSTGILLYTGNGAQGLGKERIEVHAAGNSYVLDDFRQLTAYGLGSNLRTKVADKGQPRQLDNFFRALKGLEPLGVTVTDGYWATWCAERALKREQFASGE